CVLRSLEPITDVCALPVAPDGIARVLVAVADGAVWHVTLPSVPADALHHCVLQESDVTRSVESMDSLTQMLGTSDAAPAAVESASSCRVEILFRVPGVQSVRQSGDCTLCTSVVAPSTLVWGCAVDAKHRGQQAHEPVLVELDELEAEQSTATLTAAFGIPIKFDAPVQSIAFVASLGCFVFTSRGVVFGFQVHELIARCSSSSGSSPTAPHTHFSTKLPFRVGVVAIAVHEASQALSLVYMSGRVVSMSKDFAGHAIASVLPPPGATVADETPSSPGRTMGDTSESRIKALLQRISQVSSSSAKLRAQSEQMDAHLRELHTALLVQKQVRASGVESLFSCRLDMMVVSADSFSHTKTVKLKCRVSATGSLESIASSLASWHVSVHVRSRRQLVAAFVFRLEDVLSPPQQQRVGGAERTMALDADTLEHHDAGGAIYVSCSLLFQPIQQHINESERTREHREDARARSSSAHEPLSSTSLFSFAIPLVRDKAFYLLQLSELMREADVPMSHVAIKAAFRQDHVPALSPSAGASTQGSSSTSSKESPAPLLLQGFQLWSALAEHWHDKAFAALWLRDLQEPRETEIAPPPRFALVFPAFAVSELTLEHVAAVVRSLLHLAPSMTAQKVLESCRRQGGKFWVGLKAVSGNLVVLRFALAEGIVEIDGAMLRPLEITVQCSSADDFSVMRALLLEKVPRIPGHEEMAMPLDEVLAALSLEAADFRGALDEAEALAEVVSEKVSRSLRNTESCSLCTDEVVRMLADLARVETQALDIYWKSRQVLNKFVI
ncbi:hypothetical protein PybrP1_003868, partial [[Pythium] brassicae (nom. inval.)]